MPLQLYVLVTVTTVGRRALITADVEAFRALRRSLEPAAERERGDAGRVIPVTRNALKLQCGWDRAGVSRIADLPVESRVASGGVELACLVAVAQTSSVSMPHPWSPESEHDDELEALLRSDDESWRGDAHLADEAWRGDIHLADWPEALAGPEYWMFKQLAAAAQTSAVSLPRPWSPESEPDEELAARLRPDGESWRGDAHLVDAAWRGDMHLADWPEALAGPEYWMFKKLAEAA